MATTQTDRFSATPTPEVTDRFSIVLAFLLSGDQKVGGEPTAFLISGEAADTALLLSGNVHTLSSTLTDRF